MVGKPDSAAWGLLQNQWHDSWNRERPARQNLKAGDGRMHLVPRMTRRSYCAVFVILAVSVTGASRRDDETTIRPGGTVVVTANAAQLKVGPAVVATVSKGQQLTVWEVRDNWLGTAFEKEGQQGTLFWLDWLWPTNESCPSPEPFFRWTMDGRRSSTIGRATRETHRKIWSSRRRE